MRTQTSDLVRRGSGIADPAWTVIVAARQAIVHPE
jgi:hypothetical protein